MRNNYLSLVLFGLLSCAKPSDAQTPTQNYTPPPAQNKSNESRTVDGDGWSMELPKKFVIQPRAESGQFEIVAMDKEHEMVIIVLADEYDGSTNDFVSTEIQDANINKLKVAKVQSTSWGSKDASYIEVINEDNTRIARYWATVKSKKIYSFGCITPLPTSDAMIGLCGDVAHSFKWN